MYAVWLLVGALGGALSVWFNAKQAVHQGLHPGGSPGYVPTWYPPLCIGFDAYIGAALILRLRGRGRAAAV